MIASLLFSLALIAANRALTPPAPPSDLAAAPPAAERLPDGVMTLRLNAGSGDHPTEADFVHIRYAVWRAPSGEIVDYTRAATPTFVAMDKLLPGIREILTLMSPGEKRRGWIPPAAGGGKIAADETFVVEVELLDVVHPPLAPPDVGGMPTDAQLTRSGLAYRVLRPGTGTRHPTRGSTVIVQYSGWTTDGRMFDSSVMRDEPAAFPLLSVIPGWTEGLQLMTVGEKARFWIPSGLAYGHQAGKPQGMLVFDIELLDIK